MKILWQIYKHLSAIVHDILIAFLSFYIHLGYYNNMAVCIYTSTDLYQYFYKWINNETHHQCHRYKICRVFFPLGYSPILWCYVAYCDVMLVIVMSCWLLQCHVAYCDVMLHIMISCSLFRMVWYTVKVLIFAASNFHGFSQLDKFLGTFFRIFHKTHLIEILHIDHVKNTKS